MSKTPLFYDPKNAENWGYNPDLRKLVEGAKEYAHANNIKSSGTDACRVALMPIDVQRDFCFPKGTLYVSGRSGTGAIDDSRRLTEFIYREMGGITTIFPTLDTHEAFQIFSPSFWLDDNGKFLQPHDMLDGDLTILRAGKPAGRATVNPMVASAIGIPYMDIANQAKYYCRKLVDGGKYMLYIWPEHCVFGSEGHTLVGIVQEARMFHAYVRGSQNSPQVKGGNPLTENYSIFGPEVLDWYPGSHHKGQIAQKNVRFLEMLLAYDAVVIAGQASSHCVKSSIDDLLHEIKMKDPALAKKVYILRDCTSAVVVPGVVDFTDAAEKALDEYAAAGMNIVLSTDAMASWLK